MTCATCDSTDRTIANGEHKTVKITVYESSAEDAAKQNLTGMRLVLVVAVVDTTVPIIQKDTDVGVAEAEIQTQSGATLGQVWFFLEPSDWDGHDPATYDAEVWLEDGAVRERVLKTTFVLDPAIEVDWT